MTSLQFAKRFWKHCSLEGLVHGNVTPEHAKDITKNLWSKLERSHDDGGGGSSSSCERRVTQLQPGHSYLYRFKEFNPGNTNSVVQLVLQMEALELPDNPILALCHNLIREPAFNQLRTEEQLGYIVHSSVKTSGDNIKGLLFLIQSDSFDPIHVESRVEAFLLQFRQRIVAMSQEEFQKHLDAVVSSFLEKVRIVGLRFEDQTLCLADHHLSPVQNKNLGEEWSRYIGMSS